MSDNTKLAEAKKVYAKLCEMLDNKGIKYVKHEEDLVVTFMLGSNDIPEAIIINVDAERQLVRLVSPIPAVFEGENKVAGAIATSQVNYKMADGSFDYDYKQGRIMFRLTSSYADSIISEDMLEYMLLLSAGVVDEYNDKFFMLAQGKSTIEQFIVAIS